ncbi:MAG: adenylate/guanylate cyclase domain-containing protein [Synechococcaceae cyanobacterium]|nr:adenylate/guanylate cyclase domain-containing protein [Synechococcaceae cyanobacterium]
MVLLRQAGLAEALNLRLHDLALGLRPLPSAAALPIRVVAIQESDLRRLGWPIDDRHLVTAILRLEAAGVRAIGLDLYRDIGVGAGRLALRQLAAAPGPLISVFSEIDAIPAIPGTPPARQAYNDVLLDRDGVVRRDLVHVRGQGPALVALPLRLLEHSRGQNPGPLRRQLERDPRSLAPLDAEAGGYSDLDDAGLQRLLAFHDPATIPSWSLSELLAGRVPAAALRDTIVLVGSRAPSQRDLFRVPLRWSGKGLPAGQMAGVDLHAQRLASLLALERGLRPGLTAAPGWLNGLLLLGGLLTGLVLGEGITNLRRSVVAVAAAGGAALAAGLALLLLGGFWFNLTLPLAALLALAAAAWIGRGAEQQGQRRLLQRLLGQTVSPLVAQELWMQRRRLLAGDRFRGQRRFVTILMADISGFMGLAEQLPPETLLAWLNRVLEELVAPIEASGGLVNKFTGDGLLAVFGAPLSQGREADARAALATARRIRAGIAALNLAFGRDGEPRVRLRLGLHSGWVLVGSLGSRERWEYGVIGDAVNCAARIVALKGPPLGEGCRILCSALTLELAGLGDAGGVAGGDARADPGAEAPSRRERSWGAISLTGRRRREEIWEL